MWTTLEIIFVVLGLLLVFGGNQLSLPILIYAGIACLGLALIVTGWQGILTQRLVVGRSGRYRETYTGVPAIFQGVQFNFGGLFLIGVALLSYLNNGRAIFLQMVQRPGLVLVTLGGLSVLQAVIMFWGTGDTGGSRGMQALHLVLGRLYPGLVWLALGLALSALGLFDAIAPARFDEMGGGFLEELYGVR